MKTGSAISALTCVVFALLGLLSTSSISSAQTFNQVIVFGDSNIDSGYYKALANPGGGTTYNNLWPTGVAHGAGAPTTNPGPMNGDVLAAHFGLTAKPANQPAGTNYATSGAKNVTVNSSQTGGFQAAIPTVQQISNYLAAVGGTANAQALYIVHSGDNDVNYASQDTGAGPFPANPNAYVTQAANDLAAAIKSLQTAGAKTIIVSNLAYSFPGNDAAKRALKLLYSQTLWSSLSLNGVAFIPGDYNSLRRMFVANPGYYGFIFTGTAAGQMACTQPAGVAAAWALLCSSDAAAPSTWVTPTSDKTHLCSDVDCHLNSAGQKLVGDFWFSLVAPQTNIAAAVAPTARTTTVGIGVTGFATILNAGAIAATSCLIQLPPDVPATFSYQITNAQNVPIGTVNTPVDIPAGQGQTFVFAVTPTATFSQEIQLNFKCGNSRSATTVFGLNTFLVTASAAQIPDLLSTTDTFTHEGIAHIPGTTGTGLMVTAGIDIGADGMVTCAPTPTPIGQPDRSLAATLTICQTGSDGKCTNPSTPGASSTVSVTQNQIVFFSIFARAQGVAIGFDPANKRVFLICTQGTLPLQGTPIAEVSVAVCTGDSPSTPGPAGC